MGVLVIRVWFADGGMRARLTQVDDVALDGLSVAVVGSTEELSEAVLRWAGHLADASTIPESADADVTLPSRDGDSA